MRRYKCRFRYPAQAKSKVSKDPILKKWARALKRHLTKKAFSKMVINVRKRK